MDLSLLVLVAARVRGLTPGEALSELDIEIAQRCLGAAQRMATDSPQRRACALACAIVQERPFGRDNDLIALVIVAQLLDEAGLAVTFEPSAELWVLLDQVRVGDVSVDEVVEFVVSHAQHDKESPSMFERFTPRARQVLSEAKHAAERLQHNFIGTEHLLLGVLAVDDGIGAQILREVGVGSDEVARRVQELIGPGPKAVVNNFPFTPRSKKTLELALRQALRLGHDYIGTEHILLALLEVRDGVAGQVLEAMGVTRSIAEEKVTAALVAQGWTPPSKKARRRIRQQLFTPVGFQPTSPATQARNQRLLQEITAIISENDALRAEVSRLRRLLEEHNIDPGQPESGEKPA